MISRGGPADRAGLRVGDRMTHLDGVSIASREGARKLGAVRPGQRVRVTVLRDGKSITRDLTLGTRPEVRAAIAATTPRAPTARAAPGAPVAPRFRRELRYTGKLEDVTVEVWSPAGTTVERVGDTMVITVGTSIVRLKVDPKK
jgi:membrane-associated protease RseP (regulator of RpoE activity)